VVLDVINLTLEVAGDGGARGGAGEKLREEVPAVVEEEAAHGAREQVRAQQPARVDEVAPRPADAPGHGPAARREAAQDVGRAMRSWGSSSRPISASAIRFDGEIARVWLECDRKELGDCIDDRVASTPIRSSRHKKRNARARGATRRGTRASAVRGA
jgi:hypothetical protein